MADRKQVNLDNLGKVPVTPSIQAVGGTNQAVVPGVLKDNSALRLSRSLAQFSNLLGQTSNINMQRGKDAAEKLTAEEINDIIEGKVPAPTGGALGKLGFQKAFHQIAAKRWFDTTGVQKYADLESRLDVKMDEFIQNSTPIEQVQAYVQGEVQALEGEIGEYFDGNSFGSRVKNLIGGELSTRVLAGATKGYEKKQLAYMRAANEEKRMNEFAAVALNESDENLKGYFSRMQKLYKEEGYSGEAINSIFNNTFIKGLNLAMATDTGTALGMISQAKNLEINGRQVFGSMEARLAIAKARGQISKLMKEEEDDFTLAQRVANFAGPAGKFFEVLKRSQEKGELPKNNEGMAFSYLREAFQSLDSKGGLTEAGIKIQDLTDMVLEEGNPQENFDAAIAALLGEKLDPQTRAIVSQSLDDISSQRREINKAAPEVYIGLSLTDKQQLRLSARDYFENNPSESAEDFMKNSPYPRLEPTIGVLEEYREATKFNEFMPRDAAIGAWVQQEIEEVSKDPTLQSVFKGEGDVAPYFTVGRLNVEKMDAVNKVKKALKEFAEERLDETTPDKDQILLEQARDFVKTEMQSLKNIATAMQVRLDEDFPTKGFSETEGISIEDKRIERRAEFKLEDEDESPFFEPGRWFSNVADNRELMKYKSLARKYALSVEKGVNALTKKSTRKAIDDDFKKARKNEDEDALSLLQKFYGYKDIDFNNPTFIEDFDTTSLWWDEVRLFESEKKFEETMEKLTATMIKAAEEGSVLTDEDNKILKVMADLGIYDLSEGSVFLQNFYNIQMELLPVK